MKWLHLELLSFRVESFLGGINVGAVLLSMTENYLLQNFFFQFYKMFAPNNLIKPPDEALSSVILTLVFFFFFLTLVFKRWYQPVRWSDFFSVISPPDIFFQKKRIFPKKKISTCQKKVFLGRSLRAALNLKKKKPKTGKTTWPPAAQRTGLATMSFFFKTQKSPLKKNKKKIRRENRT